MLHYVLRYILTRRIFGFKLIRFLEFGGVFVSEVGPAAWPKRIWIIGKIVVALLKAKRQPREVYQERMMKGCRNCVIYNRQTKQCGSSEEGALGCGCYMPFKAALADTPEDGCWFEQETGTKMWSK